MKTTKKTKEKKPKYSLVGEFKGKAIFIEGNMADAKEYSEYMELGFEAIDFLEKKDVVEILNTKPTEGE